MAVMSCNVIAGAAGPIRQDLEGPSLASPTTPLMSAVHETHMRASRKRMVLFLVGTPKPANTPRWAVVTTRYCSFMVVYFLFGRARETRIFSVWWRWTLGRPGLFSPAPLTYVSPRRGASSLWSLAIILSAVRSFALIFLIIRFFQFYQRNGHSIECLHSRSWQQTPTHLLLECRACHSLRREGQRP